MLYLIYKIEFEQFDFRVEFLFVFSPMHTFVVCLHYKNKALMESSITIESSLCFLLFFLSEGVQQQVSIATGPLSEAYLHTMQARSIEEFSISIGLNRSSHMNNMKTISKRICNETNIRMFFKPF